MRFNKPYLFEFSFIPPQRNDFIHQRLLGDLQERTQFSPFFLDLDLLTCGFVCHLFWVVFYRRSLRDLYFFFFRKDFFVLIFVNANLDFGFVCGLFNGFSFFGTSVVLVRSGRREGDVFCILRIIIFFLIWSFLVEESDMFFGFPGIVGLVIAFPLDEALLLV